MQNHKKVKIKGTGTAGKKIKEYHSGTINKSANPENSRTVHNKYGITGDGFKPKDVESKTLKPSKRKIETPKPVKKNNGR
jgi:hypothetical protein